MIDNYSPFCECSNPKQCTARACTRCLALDQQRYAAKSMRDLIIAAIERYDTVEGIDLRDALGLGQHDANRLSSHLSRLIQEGVIERVGTKCSGYYRAVRKGRRAA